MKEIKKNDYYYFDDENKEVVFTRHDMPSPWINYLFNGETFTMMSHSGGNLSWYKSPEIWRIGRYNFYNLPVDVNGLFLYVADKSTGEVWNPTIIPRDVKPDKWESRHGLGYTKFFAEKDGLKVSVKCFVGKDNALVYDVKFLSDRDRDITVFACHEMGLMEYLREVQWQCYCKNSNNVLYDEKCDALVYEYFADMQARPDETPFVYFCSNIGFSSYSGVRKSFVGNYRDLKNPIAIENGKLPCDELKGGEAMFSSSYELALKKGETKTLDLYLGVLKPQEDIKTVTDKLRAEGYAEKAFAALNDEWSERLAAFKVDIPDAQAARMINVWNKLQALVNFYVCREISFYATGTVRGVGVRDASQDALGIVHSDINLAKDKIKLIMTQQYACGKTNHYFYPVEKREPIVSDRSDNHLWMIYTVYAICMEEGKTDILNDSVEYYDGGCGTVFEHLERSIEYTMNHLGKDGIPLMLGSDWNDMLSNVCKKGEGESVFVAQMLVLACKQMKELCKITGKNYDKYDEIIKTQTALVNDKFFDKEWYVRAVTDEGLKLGKSGDECAEIWINSQSWAVISGIADQEKGKKAMDNVFKKLDCGYGLLKLAPPLRRNYPSKENELTFAQPGIGENGGVFCHANAWAIIAECMLGDNERAFALYKELIPDEIIKKFGVELYNAEPYVYASNIRGPQAFDAGQAGVSWLSGTAAWMVVAVMQYIFGIKPEYDGLKIQPCIPDEWEKVTVKRRFRGTDYTIIIDNGAKAGNRVKEIKVKNAVIRNGCVSSGAKTAEITVITG